MFVKGTMQLILQRHVVVGGSFNVRFLSVNCVVIALDLRGMCRLLREKR